MDLDEIAGKRGGASWVARGRLGDSEGISECGTFQPLLPLDSPGVFQLASAHQRFMNHA